MVTLWRGIMVDLLWWLPRRRGSGRVAASSSAVPTAVRTPKPCWRILPLVSCLLLSFGCSLHDKIDGGNVAAAHQQIGWGSGVLERNEYGQLPLHRAAYKGYVDLVASLLERHPETLEDKSLTGRTPMHMACLGGRTQVVDFLLLKGASMTSPDKLGRTCLHNAALGGYLDIIRLAMANGAQVNAKSGKQQDYKGYTPLHLAAAGGHLWAAEALVDAGANIHQAMDKPPLTPVMIASDGLHRDVVWYLCSLGAQPARGPTFMMSAKCYQITAEYSEKAGRVAQAISRFSTAAEYYDKHADTNETIAADAKKRAVKAFVTEIGRGLAEEFAKNLNPGIYVRPARTESSEFWNTLDEYAKAEAEAARALAAHCRKKIEALKARE